MVFRSTSTDDAIYTCRCDSNYELRMYVLEEEIELVVSLQPKPIWTRLWIAISYLIRPRNKCCPFAEIVLYPEDAIHLSRKLLFAARKTEKVLKEESVATN